MSRIPPCSGKTNEHRLSYALDRQADRALHLIVITCIVHRERTKAHAQRRTAGDGIRSEIIRCSKRHVARGLFKAPSQRQPTLSVQPLVRRRKAVRVAVDKWLFACARQGADP